MSFPVLAFVLLNAISPADPAETGVIAFPQSAGEPRFRAVEVDTSRRACRVIESSGNAETDGFACAVGPKQMRRIDGRTFAMSWLPPAVSGTFVPAHLDLGREARRGRDLPQAEATTVIRLAVDAGGRVTACKVEGGSGVPGLDTSACEGHRRLRYRPATLNGSPVAETRFEVVGFVREVVITREP